MSLRTRLLLASVAVTLVALLVADAATYAALESFLTDRIDQNLSQSVTGPGCGAGPAAPGGTAGAGAGTRGTGRSVGRTGGRGPSRAAGRTSSSASATARSSSPTPPSSPTARSFSPALPAHLPTGTAGPDGTSNVYLTVPSTAAGGPQFRVLVHTEADGDVTVVGLPLDSVAETLHRLLLIELAVTVAALAASALLGLWLVRLGLRPLSDVEATAEAIAAGDLGRRVPGDDRRTEVGRLARRAEHDAGADPTGVRRARRARRPSCAGRRSACGGSSATPRTSCGRRWPRSPPTPSCIGVVPMCGPTTWPG